MTLLVVGASGFLGGEVCRQVLAGGGQRVVGTYHRAPGPLAGVDWRPLDVRDLVAVRELVAEVRPDAVVNTSSGYADWPVTADGAGHVALAAARAGTRLVHLSSDAVHGGRPEPYPDDEAPAPVYPYGAAKAAAESAVRLVAPDALVVRTSLILGDAWSRQIRFCLDALKPGSGARLFRDEYRAPVAVADLAAAVRELVATDHAGLLNVAGPDVVTRAELGELVARHHGLDPAGLATATIGETGLVRPAEVRLDSSRAVGMLRTRLRGVRELLPPA